MKEPCALDLATVNLELLRLLEAQVGGERLGAFIDRLTPRHSPPPHLAKLIKLVEAARIAGIRACVSLPPRHGKTTTILHGLAWMVSRDPRLTHAYVSYSDDLSRSKSRIARRLAEQAGATLAKDSKNLAEWRTEAGGGLLATGVGGPLTGQGVTGCLVVDDPIKNRQEAESANAREKLWEWFGDVAYTRLEPGASCIVVATRWHSDDLIGRLAKTGEWEVLNLPAVSNAGRALWPERFPVRSLDEIKAQIGEFSFASLYQGLPRPKGAKVFQSPARYDPQTFSLEGKRLIIGVDPAASEKTSADYSVAVVMATEGVGILQRAWVLEVLRAQVTVPELVQRLRDLQAKYRAPLAVESVGAFKAVPQMLRSVDRSLRILEVHPAGDKFTRAQPIAAAWNAGRVFVPSRGVWVNDFVAEVQSFTGVKDAQDDQVDALAHSWNSVARYVDVQPREVAAPFLAFG